MFKKDQEVSACMTKIANLEAQNANLKRERDRLLEVSKNLRISMNKLEKQQIFNSMSSQVQQEVPESHRSLTSLSRDQ